MKLNPYIIIKSFRIEPLYKSSILFCCYFLTIWNISQNYQGWKIPLRSSSATIILAPSQSPLNHTPQVTHSDATEHFQRW